MEKSNELITLDQVRKVYRMGQEKIIALDNVTVSFVRENIYGLLGTSGSGKSTLLNVMAGLEKPSRGSIRIKKYRIEKMTESQLAKFRQDYVGFIFQSFNLLPALNALENVTLPLIFRGVSRKTREKQARNWLKAVGLGDRLYHRPFEMSGGQQQRVSIARAFVNRPEIVFADEPTGNLDSRTTKEIMDLITGIVRENRQTLIIVTHDQEVASYTHTIVHLNDGSIEKIVTNEREGAL